MNIWSIDNFVFKPVNVDAIDVLKLKLTIDSSKIDGDLTYFPVLVTLSSGVGINSFDTTKVFDEVGSYSNRKKITVTDSAENQLYTEIERWDHGNENAELWVKVPAIVSGTDTIFYLYYENTQGENTTYIGDIGDTPAKNVWDSNFKGVWHLNDVEDILDSTVFGNDGGWSVGTTNIALWKTCAQSTTMYGMGANLAVNNNTGDWNHTNALGSSEWWKIDLGAEYVIVKINMFKRMTNRPYYFYIQTADDYGFTTNVVNIITENNNTGLDLTWDTDDFGLNVNTRYLRVQCHTNTQYINIKEFRVYSMSAGDLVDGKVGKAIDFDGTDDAIDCGSNASLDNISTITIESIFKPEGWGEGSSGRMASKSAAWNEYGWNLFINDTDDKFGFIQGWSTTNGVWYAPTNSIILDEWHYSAVQYDRSYSMSDKPIMYLNGTFQTVTTSQAPVGIIESDAAQKMLIGARIAATNYDREFDGILDEIRVSDIHRALEWLKATHYSSWDDLITYDDIFIPAINEVRIYDKLTETLSGTIYHDDVINSVWANNDYLYIGTTNSGVIWSPMSSISGAVYDDLSVYKMYPDIHDNHVNYIHGAGNYLCVATISGVNIIDLTTNSGVYTNASIIASKCYQVEDRTSYYMYDDKLETVYSDDSTYLYESADGIIPTVSGINDIYIVNGTKNVIFLATTAGTVVIEENKGSEALSRFKYYYVM